MGLAALNSKAPLLPKSRRSGRELTGLHAGQAQSYLPLQHVVERLKFHGFAISERPKMHGWCIQFEVRDSPPPG